MRVQSDRPETTPDLRYWMYETSGVLRPAIEAYFSGLMTDQHIAAMRAYLRQWIAGRMSAAGQKLCDGRGLLRTAELVLELVN